MDWSSFVQDLVYAIITAAIPVITVFLVKFLTRVSNKVSIDAEETVLKNTLNEVSDLIINVVSCTSQTYVDQLKKAGTFDEAAQEEAFKQTKETILALLSEESKDILETLYQDVDTWLDVQIESSVRMLNNTNSKAGE